METHIFICGAKSVGQYGGYETFVDKLTQYHQDRAEFHYHILCKANGAGCMDERSSSETSLSCAAAAAQSST